MASACLGYSLIFNVFDPVTFKPWKNVDALGNNLYLSGSASANCDVTRNDNFEFSYTGFHQPLQDGSFHGQYSDRCLCCCQEYH